MISHGFYSSRDCFDMANVDVIVVGAALSGLSAALMLQTKGVKVVVLEAQNRVGGRTLTEEVTEYDPVDMGGSSIAPFHHPLLNLANQMGVSSYRQDVSNRPTQKIWYQNGKCVPYSGDYPRFWNPFINLDFNNTIRELNRLSKSISVTSPWDSPKADYLDSISVDDWARKNIWTRTVYGFIRFACRMDMTVTEPKQISMLYFLWFLKQFPGLIGFFPSPSEPKEKQKGEFKLVGGTQQVSVNIALKLGESCVHTDTAVSRIEQMEDGVVVTSGNGTQYRGKHVVLAMSPSLYLKVDFTPPLPDERIATIKAMRSSCFIKSILFYNRTFWSKSDMNQVTIGTDDDLPVISSRLYFDKARPVATCVSSVDVDGFGQWTKQERQDFLCDFLFRVSGSKQALHPVKYTEMNWAEDPYSGGCVAGILPPGMLTRYKFNFRKPFKRVYFAGSETAHKWVGQMAGAVIAGERAAKEILLDLKKTQSKDLLDDAEAVAVESDPLPHYYENAFIYRVAPGVGDVVKLTIAGIGIVILLIIIMHL